MKKLLDDGRVSHLFILVRDLARMVAFYRETLGLDLLYYEKGAFAFLCLPGRPDFQIALYPGRGEENVEPGTSKPIFRSTQCIER